MSFYGIFKGIVKTVEGITEADGEKVMKGITGTALSTAGTIVKHVIDDQTGENLSEQGEQATDD
ncbi:MAG: hypothetical protein HC836_46025 [Richelia sp. RM2_1_2]|nr:hypothetical protein [Richelia sp. RM2_1_2]